MKAAKAHRAALVRPAAPEAAVEHGSGNGRAAARRRRVTVHGMRNATRSWMADQGVAFELAEAALGHQVGNAVVQAYQRSSMLERRRPVLAAWATFVTGSTSDNVVPINRGVA